MNYKRIELLPYDLNELEPIISFKTMKYHYGILHKNYEIKLNEALQGTGIEKKFSSLEKLLENLEVLADELKEDVRFFGGGLINHNFFFTHLTKMSENSEKNINSELLKNIEKNFTNFENLKKQLLKNSLKIRGSG
jgi:Fe-Mn family superoxide dismutase